MDSYLGKAIANFEKKITTIKDIRNVNERIMRIASGNLGINEEKYNEYMEEKSKLLEIIDSLNDESDEIYTSLSAEINSGRDNEPEMVKKMMILIDEVNMNSKEAENDEKIIKELMEKYFSKEREKIKAAHKNSGAAINYYQTMSASKNVESMFYDNKN